MDDAKGRAIAWLSTLRRAVTLSDFEQIALATPGVPVARVQALADYDPTLTCVPALGSVTVVVVPSCANPIPEPGPNMLRAVEQYLEAAPHSPTTELHVCGPSFITLAVRATLHTGSNVDTRNVTDEARSRLDTFLHPLHGGADGQAGRSGAMCIARK